MEVSLTPQQTKAYEANQNRVIVSAGAGSGKTRVLVERFVRLVRAGHAKLEEILLVTFTDKAAKEMRERILQRFETQGMDKAVERFGLASIGTIHSFCAQILAENQLHVPIPANYQMLDHTTHMELLENGVKRIFEESYEKGDLSSQQFFVAYGLSSIVGGFNDAFAKLKSLGLTPKDLKVDWDQDEASKELQNRLKQTGLGNWLADSTTNWDQLEEWRSISFGRGEKDKKEALQLAMEVAWEFKAQPLKKELLKILKAVWEIYEEEKLASGFVEYDDFQILTRDLLRRNVKLCQKYKQKYKFIMVDEYQDTNPLQVEILNLLSRGDNDFVVGDKKQAIYGFRHADVEAFSQLEKELSSKNQGLGLALDENFRSSQEVLHFVNTFFETVWSEDPQLDYRPLLIPKAKRECNGGGAEIALLDSNVADLSLNEARVIEAAWIVERIQKLVQEEGFQYSDIVLLIRSTTVLSIYEQAFTQAGIPLFLVSGRGFYAQQEIYDVINMLKVIDNSKLDIPLASFLRSPFVGITDETLYWASQFAKEKSREDPLLRALDQVDAIPNISEEEKEKLKKGVAGLKNLRRKAPYWNLSRLIEEGVQAFQYGSKTLCYSDGKQRLANIQKLIQVAWEFEQKRPSATLAEFVPYANRLLRDDTKEEEASLEEEMGNVVRVMTMHKSKGLEFPVVFAIDLGREDLNQRGDFRFSSDGRFAVKVRNPITHQKEKPYWFQTLNQQDRQKELAEKKRLFYVVATRAINKLILVGSAKITEDKKKKNIESPIPNKSWAQWLQYVFKLGSPEQNLPVGTTFTPIECPTVPLESAENASGEKRATLPADLLDLSVMTKESFPSATKEQEPLQVSVTQLMHYQECPYRYYLLTQLGWSSWGGPVEKEDQTPSALSEELSAQNLGVLVHRVLEKVPFSELKSKGKTFVQESFPHLSLNQSNEVLELAQAFTKTPVFEEVLKAKKVYKEWPFLISLKGAIIEGTLDLVYLTEQDEICVIDYKTSLVNAQKLKQKTEEYRFQLELYMWATSFFFDASLKRKGGLLFLKSEDFVPILPPQESFLEKKLAPLLTALSEEQFTPTPSYQACSRCAAKSICPASLGKN